MAKRKIDLAAIEEANPEPPISELNREIEAFITEYIQDAYPDNEFNNNEMASTREGLRVRVAPIILAAAKEALMLKEEVSVYYPEQLFSPVPFMSFRCGNIWYKTVVLPGETEEQAYQRAWNYVSAQVRDQFTACKQDFWDRHRDMGI